MVRTSMRRLAASLFLAGLGGVLLGCGGEPKRSATVTVTTRAERGITDPPTPTAPGEKKEPVAADAAPLGDVAEAARVPAGPPALPSPALTGLTADLRKEGVRLNEERMKRAGGSKVDAVKALEQAAGHPASQPGRPVVASTALKDGPAEKSKAAPRPEAKPADPVANPVPGKAAAAAADPVGAESYGLYRENEYRSPLAAPLSTFSADVNTASFSNVRRFLTDGRLPPKDAVFLAEFVNYFPYEYAKPKGNDPIAFNLELGPCPWNRKHHLVRVGVQSQALDPAAMPPRKLTFLIDTSGSMSDANKLPLVKQALGLLIDQLSEKDTVGLVTYAGTAGVALPPTSGNEKEKIRAAVNGLGAGGSTNGEGGLRAAYDLARTAFDEKAVNRVLLCTDGDFNVGVSDRGELTRLIEQQRKSGVFLTVLGFGMGNYKDDTLKDLANHGNGHHAYIDTLDEAKKVFVEQGGALVLVAKDVKFQVEFNPARVHAYRLVGYENRLLKDEDFRNDAKDAGDVGSGHQVTVLYEVVPVGVPLDLPKVDGPKYTTPAKANPAAPDEWLTVKMRFKRPDSEVSKDADELAQPLKGDAKVADLSADFEFAAAAASFGMLLRDSEFKGGMTYAGVREMAEGALGKDPGGHRRAFIEMVKQAEGLAKSKAGSAAN